MTSSKAIDKDKRKGIGVTVLVSVISTLIVSGVLSSFSFVQPTLVKMIIAPAVVSIIEEDLEKDGSSYMKKLTDHMDGEIKKYNEIIEKRVGKLESQMRKAGGQIRDAGKLMKEAGKQIRKAGRKMGDAKTQIKEAGSQMQRAGRQIRKAGRQMQ